MAAIAIPVVLMYELPQELADATRHQQHPYRLRLVPRGTSGVWVEVLILPQGTDGWEPVEDCCHVCLEIGEATPVEEPA